MVVLGFPGESWATRAVQRWRVDIALKSIQQCGCDRVIFTGGPTRSSVPESKQMSDLAIRLGLDPAIVVLDELSRTTWENVVEASRLAGDVDYVVLVSDAPHAARARDYWLEQHPGSTTKMMIADRYTPMDRVWFRVPAALIELRPRSNGMA